MPALLTVAEVADELSVSTQTVDRYCKTGALPSLLLSPGRNRRVTRADLDRFIQQRAAEAREAALARKASA